MRKYGYLVVEGPHDVEFAYRLLKPRGLERVRQETELDPFFRPLIPRTFPPDGDLQKRVPVPLFLQSDTHAVAVHGALGVTRLVKTVEENETLLGRVNLSGIGVVLDADSAESPAERHAAMRDAFRERGYDLPDEPGVVSVGPPRLGCFILPDNRSPGTLEDVLLECAEHVYPALLASAKTHVENASNDAGLSGDDKVEIKKPTGPNKAVVGSIASVLKPGRAVQVSLQDNRWLCESALDLPRVRAVQKFLENLFELP